MAMLRAATVADLPFVRRVLSEGAADGSFDPELAGVSPAASLFFANLADALRFGYLRVPDADGNVAGETHVAGYVYCPEGDPSPVGFGLFKALGAGGFELWLTGIAAEARAQGHGHRMLGELLATPAGQQACVIRCNRKSRSVDVALRLFQGFGFTPCRETPATFWLVNAKASPELVAQISRSAVLGL
jgi:ribosomal protein S18 acetylase RimI-like enzyme